MTVLQTLILGLIQGATEFLPISSSGHLVWVPNALGWAPAPPSFDVLVHFGTLIALTAFYRRDLWAIARSCLRWAQQRTDPGAASEEDCRNRRVAVLLLIGTAPAAAAGLLLKDRVEALLTSEHVWHVGAFLLVSAGLAWFVHRRAPGDRSPDALSPFEAILVGVAQACALMPGLSRSGATIATGVACGLRREDAARFGFLLAFPVILGATLLEAKELAALQPAEMLSYGVGFLAAVVSGYLAIGAVLAFLKRRAYYVFAVYCALVGASLIVWELVGR